MSSSTRGVATVGLVLVGLSIAVFGLIAFLHPSGVATESGVARADGLASLGPGLFGLAITWWPYRQGQRWAWATLWFYPVFWFLHLALSLPPAKDHVHQIAGVLISVAALAVSRPNATESCGLGARRGPS